MGGVGVGEEKVQLARFELCLQTGALLLELADQVLVVLGQLPELDQVESPVGESAPGFDLLAGVGRLSRELPGPSGVVPDAGLGEPAVQLLQPG